MSIKTLEKNVINIWKDKGRSWLNKLPDVITELSERWSLSDITPVNNMNFNYVAKAKQTDTRPVILKISCDQQLIEDEFRALSCFNGKGSIKILNSNMDLNALLLEQAIPGYLLKEHLPNNNEDTIKIYAKVVKALASHSRPSGECTHVIQWCKAIDRIHDKQIKPQYIDMAKEVREFLLSSKKEEYFCHGDLHLENIIFHGNRWLSIDPKGIIGEMAFEAAAFDLIAKHEWRQPELIQDKILNRIDLLANNLALDTERLLGWIYLRVIISAQWFIEDKGDPSEMLNLASVLYPLFNKSEKTFRSY